MIRYFYCFLLSLFCLFNFSCNSIPTELKTAEQLMETAPDSALHLLQNLNGQTIKGSYSHALYALLLSQALDKRDSIADNDSLISIATDYFDESDPVYAGYAWFYHSRTANSRDSVNEQAKNLLKANDYAQKSSNYKLLGLVNYEMATMHFNQRQYNKSILYFKIAKAYFEKLNDNDNIVLSDLYTGYSYLYLTKIDSAQIYYKQAVNLATKIKNKILLSIIMRNVGTVYFQQGNYSEALRYFYRVPLTANKIYDSNKYYLLAGVYIKTNNLDSAKYFLHKVDNLQQIAPDYYRLWQAIAEKENNKIKALYFANMVSYVTDSIYKRKLEISFSGLEKKYKYQGLQIINQDLNLKSNQRGLYVLVLLLTLSICIVLFLFWRLRARNKEIEYQTDIANKKQELLAKEQEKTEKERENNALLEKQLKFQAILLLNIEQHRDNSAKQTGYWNKKKHANKPAQNVGFNKELKACVDMEYNNISLRLKEKYPELSDNDIITCCMMLTGFDTGMIATVFDVNIESIFIRRSRIRKKINLDESEKLEQFLRVF